MARNDIALGIDVGGTFTDVLAFDRTSGVIISAFKCHRRRRTPLKAR